MIMKRTVLLMSLLISFSFVSVGQAELAPFVSVNANGNMDEVITKVETSIEEANFNIIGKYEVAGNSDLQVICFTNDDLKKTCSLFSDRGALASILKIGIRKHENKIEVSLINPEYMFNAYFGKNYTKQGLALKKIDKKAKNILVNAFGSIKEFGGKLEKDELREYHYKVMMPYFQDAIVLEEYDSFEKGLEYIRKKIAASGKDLVTVYEVVIPGKKMAVFGIGLHHAEIGEGHFLPIIGERQIAAMPYEIILQDKEVSMLPGKYRFALYWPELTMGEFMKIMSTPGDVEEALEGLVKK